MATKSHAQASRERGQDRWKTRAYASYLFLGVFLTMLLALLVLSAAVPSLAYWGMVLGVPLFVLGLAALIPAIAASLFGLLERSERPLFLLAILSWCASLVVVAAVLFENVEVLGRLLLYLSAVAVLGYVVRSTDAFRRWSAGRRRRR